MALRSSMSERRVLALVERYPHPTALARRARRGSLFPILRHLEANGLLRRRQGTYQLTRQGRNELATTDALIRLVVRTGMGRSGTGGVL